MIMHQFSVIIIWVRRRFWIFEFWIWKLFVICYLWFVIYLRFSPASDNL